MVWNDVSPEYELKLFILRLQSEIPIRLTSQIWYAYGNGTHQVAFMCFSFPWRKSL